MNSGFIGYACLVILDEVIIVGRTFEDYLCNLELEFCNCN